MFYSFAGFGEDVVDGYMYSVDVFVMWLDVVVVVDVVDVGVFPDDGFSFGSGSFLSGF